MALFKENKMDHWSTTEIPETDKHIWLIHFKHEVKNISMEKNKIFLTHSVKTTGYLFGGKKTSVPDLYAYNI